MSDANQFFQPVRGDGAYEVGVNDHPNSAALIGHAPNAAPSGTDATMRVTAVTGPDNRTGLHTALLDHTGTPYSALNPMPAYLTDGPGPDLHSRNDSGDLAKNASSNHDFAPSGTFKVTAVRLSAITNARGQVLLNGSELDRLFTSAANQKDVASFDPPLTLANGDIFRVTKTNLDNQAQSVYSRISGFYI